MKYVLDIERLKKDLIKKTFIHKFGEKMSILPFVTRNQDCPSFKNGFQAIVGEVTRSLLNIQPINSENDLKEIVLKSIALRVEMDEKDKEEFTRIIGNYLIDEYGNVKIWSFKSYTIIPRSKSKENVGEKKIADFLFDIFFDNKVESEIGFEKNLEENVLTLLIDTFFINSGGSERIESNFENQLPFITSLFQEDFNWMKSNPKILIRYFDSLLYYYYFYYITQLSLKLKQFDKGDYSKVTPVYFTLDWEKTSKRRLSYEYGWKAIESASKELLIHVNVLEQLNYLNIDSKKPKNYPQMVEEIHNQEEFFNSVTEWIEIYKSCFQGDISEAEWSKLKINNDKTVVSAILNLYNAILLQYQVNRKKGGAMGHFQDWVENCVKVGLSKPRGQLGRMLNCTQDFLIFFIVISLKNQRASLNDMFVEFERRGLFFDQISQQEIINLLDHLNLLEKKSDSGDAQYVKPIL